MIKKQLIIAANVCFILGASPIALFAKGEKSKTTKTKSGKNAKADKKADSDVEDDEDSKARINLDNPYISPEDILSQKGVWFEMHLEERVNTPFFTSGREISRHIVKAVMEGKITPYKDDVCTIPMSIDDFLRRLRDPNLGVIDEEADFVAKEPHHKKGVDHDLVPAEDERFRSKELSILVIKSRVITDIIRSIQRIIVDSITLRIPAKRFPNGIQRDVASFKFADLQSYFDSLNEDDCWIDPDNEMGNRKFSDAFRNLSLWFPQSYLVLTEKMKIYGLEPDPSKSLDLKKSDIITEEAYLWVY